MRMRRTLGLSLALLLASAAVTAKQAHAQSHRQSPVRDAGYHPERTATSKTRHAALPRSTAAKARMPIAARVAACPRSSAAALPPPDQYIGPMRVIGQRQVGRAAWYGGHLVGGRTANGERLDTVHATAAHRSLPLDSLVRVTNLRNGRSVIAKINDRGPVSRSLLIDVSPKVAEELDMKRSGIATVAIEQVAPAPTSAR